MEAASKSLLPFLGTIVRTQREAEGWSQEELAERADLFASQISLLERAERVPKLPTLDRLARAFGIPCFALVWQAEMLRQRVESEETAEEG